MLESLPRHRNVCIDLVYLCSFDLRVATLGSLSRHRSISSTSSVLQHWILLLQPSLNKHHMSRPRLSVMTGVSSSFGVATYFTLSRHKSFFEDLLLSQQAFPCCHNQCRGRRGFCCRQRFCLMFFVMLQHKLIHCSIFLVLLFNFLS